MTDEQKQLDALKAPLRKVVREYNELHYIGHVEYAVEMEELECGHSIRRKSDIYGPTNADKRRCRLCVEEARRVPS